MAEKLWKFKTKGVCWDLALFLNVENAAVWPMHVSDAFPFAPVRLAHQWCLHLHSDDLASRQVLPLA